MHAALRALPFAFGALHAATLGRAQPAELPPIFAPRETEPVRQKPPAATSFPRTSLASERMRAMINAAANRVLTEAAVFEAPGAPPSGSALTVDAATVMAPVVVKAGTLKESDLRRPVVPTGRFSLAEPARGIAGGVTMPLYHTYDFMGKELQIDFNILNGAGRGADHGRDFTRAEIAFRFKF
jgi:hypothetical protein